VFPTLARGLFTEELEEGDEVPPGMEGVEGREVTEVKGEDKEGAEGTGGDVREDSDEGGGPAKKRKIRERIVARGYDKFFNIDEVPWTYVSTLLPLPVTG
jgi:tRNA ligase